MFCKVSRFIPVLVLTCTICVASAEYWALNQTFQVCISSWAPFAFVDPTGKHTGYDYDLFVSVAHRMRLNYVVREAASWDAMLLGLTLPPDDPEHCDIAPTGLPWDDAAFATSQASTEVAGIQLSIPTLRGGFGIATKVGVTAPDMWSFTRVFSEELWATIVCGSLFLSFIVYVSEKNFHDRGMGKIHYPLEFKGGMYEAFYRVFGKLWNVVSDLNVVSIISKIISLAWGVATIVLIANYTASLAGYLTAERIETAISGVEELKGGVLPAVTYVAAVERLDKSYNLNLSSFYWYTDQDGIDMLNKVRTGQYAAMVMDKPWLRYYTANLCDIAILDQTLAANYLGWGLNKYMPQYIIDAVNSMLLQLQEEGVQEMIERAYLPDSNCKYNDQGPISFLSLAGLWIIMGASMGLSLLLLLLPHLSKRLEMDVPGVVRSNSVLAVRSLMSFLTLGGITASARGRAEDAASESGDGEETATANGFNGAPKAAAAQARKAVPDVECDLSPPPAVTGVINVTNGSNGYGAQSVVYAAANGIGSKRLIDPEEGSSGSGVRSSDMHDSDYEAPTPRGGSATNKVAPLPLAAPPAPSPRAPPVPMSPVLPFPRVSEEDQTVANGNGVQATPGLLTQEEDAIASEMAAIGEGVVIRTPRKVPSLPQAPTPPRSGPPSARAPRPMQAGGTDEVIEL